MSNFSKILRPTMKRGENRKMNITIVGAGYVGLSLAILLSQKNDVILLDINKNKINKINNKISPIKDKEIEKYLKNKTLKLKATLNRKTALKDANFIVISTPTNYDNEKHFFDTSSVEEIIKCGVSINKNAPIIIKSTVPVGFTEKMKRKYDAPNIMFSPEFLREGKALYDNLYPSRIIVGGKGSEAKKFANLLKEGAIKKDVFVKFMNSTEAEAVKLFSNTYLALRVAFFNELDTFSEINNLKTKNIIDGVCLDTRIGNFYNNPSFGYGGYCLPKDTKQLLANFENVPQNLIEAIIKSNHTRKEHIVKMIMNKNANTVGIYKLTMKKDSDNFRTSAICEIIDILKQNGVNIIIYEPMLNLSEFDDDIKIENNFEKFMEISDVILANRMDEKIMKFKDKVYTRDLFGRD